EEIKNSEVDDFLYVIYIRKLPKNLLLKCLFYINYRIINHSIKNEFNKKDLKYFGVDHVFFADFLNRYEYILIEDGLLNYIYNSKRKNRLYNFFISNNKTYGRSDKCSKIYLTGIRKIPNEILNKVELLSIDKKDTLNDYYGELIKDSFILITQPLSEDGVITENEKIGIYKNIILKYNKDKKNIVIKPHPREKTDYSKLFKDTKVMNKNTPFEYFSNTIAYDNVVITLFSTAIYNICVREKIFVGTKINNKILKYFGDISE
ncbi:hypothetical protein CTM96_21710, partial [Photobacterium phosphoreum]